MIRSDILMLAGAPAATSRTGLVPDVSADHAAFKASFEAETLPSSPESIPSPFNTDASRTVQLQALINLEAGLNPDGRLAEFSGDDDALPLHSEAEDDISLINFDPSAALSLRLPDLTPPTTPASTPEISAFVPAATPSDLNSTEASFVMTDASGEIQAVPVVSAGPADLSAPVAVLAAISSLAAVDKPASPRQTLLEGQSHSGGAGISAAAEETEWMAPIGIGDRPPADMRSDQNLLSLMISGLEPAATDNPSATPLLQPVANAPVAGPSPQQVAQIFVLPGAAPEPPVLTAAVDQIPDLLQSSGIGQDELNSRVIVQLDPHDLGRVSLDFKFEDQILQSVTVLAETPEAMRKLRSMHFELVQALEQRGLSGENLHFGQQSSSDQRPFSQSPHSDRLMKMMPTSALAWARPAALPAPAIASADTLNLKL